VRRIVPDLFFAEVGNALWRIGQRPGFDRAVLTQAYGALLAALSSVAPVRTLASEALDLAYRLDHPFYDCAYLALARREAVPLVTADTRLLRKVAMSSLDIKVLDLGGLPV
jgi:predicted nucleic acid-binding protein